MKVLGTNVAAPIVPFTTEDEYPTHVDEYGKGGLMALPSTVERDAIPDGRLKVGMFVSTVDDKKLWRLDGLDPVVWTLFAGVDGDFAPIDSPEFIGTPTAPTADPGSDTNQIATTAFVVSAINGIGYLHTQADPATVWTVNHNLGYKPAVELYTVGGMEFEAEVLHTSVNQLIVYLVVEIAGFVRCI
ncbi:hypothetical protein [Hyphomicrobium sp. ghe19]|uniref:hypothetical protein n=1 Tax=Hyphomicrobium sp. ghe19 TaxID=2682968 RepID=UPI0013671215|nr:hypothetical protein HYPP_02415 [Hyphomicrobium sp. ghe19]